MALLKILDQREIAFDPIHLDCRLNILVKASILPAGEKAGERSPFTTVGDVSCCFAPVSTESRKMLRGACGEVLSTIATDFPSADQAGRERLASRKPSIRSESTGPADSPNFRSGPPRAGTIMISVPRGDWR